MSWRGGGAGAFPWGEARDGGTAAWVLLSLLIALMMLETQLAVLLAHEKRRICDELMRGTLIERCTDGVRSTVSATCVPVTHCDTGWSKRSGFPQVTYTYDARPEAKHIPVGEYAAATGSDGSTLRVQCVAGEIKPAPQCTAGQKVTQTYSGGAVDPATGKHLGDTRVYRYDGEPVDPGKLVKLMQIEGRPKPDGSPRFLMARCSASGQLQ